MKKYKNKYFKKINYKNSCTENLFFRMSGDKRAKKWKSERKKFGGYDSRVTWNLNTFMTEQIYTWLKMYFDRADGYVDLNFHKFQINGGEMSEREAVLLAISDMEYYLCNSEVLEQSIENECARKIAEAFYIIGIIFPALWW